MLGVNPLPEIVRGSPPPREPLPGSILEITGKRTIRRSVSVAMAISALPRLPTRNENSSITATRCWPDVPMVNDNDVAEDDVTTHGVTSA